MNRSVKPAAFPLLRPTSLRVNVADFLRTVLLNRGFQPGEELTDSALAAKFGVSRGPIREALIILAEEGLVEHRHYRGFRVPILNAADLLQVNEARSPLEILALEQARARKPSPQEINLLVNLKQALIEAHARSTDDLSLTAYPDYAFHYKVWELSGNPWLVAGLKRICSVRFLYVSARSLGFVTSDQLEMDRKHQQYIDYITDRCSHTAEECVARHLKLDRSESVQADVSFGESSR